MKRPTHRETCVTCGALRSDVGRMSWTGQCPSCGMKALAENIHGLTTHSGPSFDRWRRAMAASVGGVLVSDTRTER